MTTETQEISSPKAAPKKTVPDIKFVDSKANLEIAPTKSSAISVKTVAGRAAFNINSIQRVEESRGVTSKPSGTVIDGVQTLAEFDAVLKALGWDVTDVA